MQPTKWSLILAAAEGDATARALFARHYMDVIRAYLGYRWRDSSLAQAIEDAGQEVFIELIKPEGALQRADPDQGSFRSLLHGVVRNVARRFEEKAFRTGHRVRGHSVFLDSLPDDAETLSRVFDREWARALLREALLDHASEARAGGREARRRFRIMRMRHQQDMPIREIAARLHESDVAVVHTEYRRARREFSRCLRRVVASHTGAAGEAVDVECRRLGTFLAS